MKFWNKKVLIYTTVFVALTDAAVFLYYKFYDVHHQKIILAGKTGQEFIEKAEKGLPEEEKLLLRSYIITKKLEGTYKDNQVSVRDAIGEQRVFETKATKEKAGKIKNGAELSDGERWERAVTNQGGAFERRCSRGMKETGLCN